MKKKILIFGVISLLIFSISFTNSVTSVKIKNVTNNTIIKNNDPTGGLFPKCGPVIRINGEGDFDYDHGVTSGAGTFENPYIIEGWTGLNGIEILDTKYAYFVIKNCTINSPIIDTIKFGLIQFENVENGVIEDCTIQSDMMMQYMSCYIEESENIIIKNCLISSPNHIIYLVSSNYIEIHHCEITAMGLYNWFCHGLDFISSSNNIIHHCDIHNTATGIHFDDYEGKSKNNLFYSNNLYDNELNANIKPYNNYWNDTNGNGNFWSDYKEWYRQTYDKEPTSSDGEIWDDPYIINGYNQDNYPLVKKIPQTKSKDLPNKLIKLFCIFPLFQRLLNL